MVGRVPVGAMGWQRKLSCQLCGTSVEPSQPGTGPPRPECYFRLRVVRFWSANLVFRFPTGVQGAGAAGPGGAAGAGRRSAGAAGAGRSGHAGSRRAIGGWMTQQLCLLIIVEFELQVASHAQAGFTTTGRHPPLSAPAAEPAGAHPGGAQQPAAEPAGRRLM